MEQITEKINIKDIVKGTMAKFEYASCNKIWYKIIGEKQTCLVPIDLSDSEDVGTTMFGVEYKAITILRYVNKAIKSGELVVYPTIK